MAKFGIDISTWQKEYPYDRANAEGVQFAILRAGFGTKKDNQFEIHYANAKRLGWGVGAYWYIYATTVEGAKVEAKAFLEAIADKQFEYPVYLDIEDPSLRKIGRDTLDAMIRAFGEIIESAGYYFGVYTNVDWYKNVISGAELNQKYDWWIASWSSNKPNNINAGLWQFGGSTNIIRSNKVAGVVTDQDYNYKDYPTLIKSLGLNGFGKTNSISHSTSSTSKSIDELAQEIIQGMWGNGDDRKNRLTSAGYDYNAVQDKVNELLSANKPAPAKKSVDQIAREVINGVWGNGGDRKNRLETAGYDYSEVQNKVNQILGINKKSIDTIAREVIRGNWGNGQERKNKLTQAGYNYKEVQSRVNELLR